MVYIPSTVGEVSEMAGAMVLCMPDMELYDGVDMDGTYARLEQGLDLIRRKLGEGRYQKLIEMARHSKQKFVDGDDLGGREVLVEMKKVLRRKV